MGTHVRLSDSASTMLQRLAVETGASQTAVVENALKHYARVQRRLQIKQALEAHPWESSDRVDEVYEAGLDNTAAVLSAEDTP
jgi:hypothetical protein